MVFENEKKRPSILFFILYSIKLQLIWTVTSIFIFYIIRCCKGDEWTFIQHMLSWIRDTPIFCCIGFMPVLAPAVYFYQCFSMVEKITIDEKEKVLQIDYRPFFFWNKTRTYQMDNPNFCCEMSTCEVHIFTKLFLPYCSTLLMLSYSTEDRVPVYLKDTCGWKRENILEVYQALKKYNHSVVPFAE